MNLYVISPCLLQDIKDKQYYSKILFVFASDNSLKVAIDNNGVLLSSYEAIAEKNKDITMMGWLDLMSKRPCSFERILEIGPGTDLNKVHLLVCSNIAGVIKPMIVYTKQSFKHFEFISDNQILYEGDTITLFDRDEAIQKIDTKKICIDKIEGSSITMQGNVNNK